MKEIPQFINKPAAILMQSRIPFFILALPMASKALLLDGGLSLTVNRSINVLSNRIPVTVQKQIHLFNSSRAE
jgi:hypothetical protein